MLTSRTKIDTPRVWVGCVTCVSNGDLNGRWTDAIDAETVFPQDLHNGPTTHDEPTFRIHNSQCYCVANMPGAVPETSTYALTNATLPYVVALADEGWKAALDGDPALAAGLNVAEGRIVYQAVAEAYPDLPA